MWEPMGPLLDLNLLVSLHHRIRLLRLAIKEVLRPALRIFRRPRVYETEEGPAEPEVKSNGGKKNRKKQILFKFG